MNVTSGVSTILYYGRIHQSDLRMRIIWSNSAGIFKVGMAKARAAASAGRASRELAARERVSGGTEGDRILRVLKSECSLNGIVNDVKVINTFAQNFIICSFPVFAQLTSELRHLVMSLERDVVLVNGIANVLVHCIIYLGVAITGHAVQAVHYTCTMS